MVEQGLDELLVDLGALSGKPYEFVLWAFQWGEPGSELADYSGPEKWQTDVLKAIEEGLLTLDEAIRIAVASGHGVGKSALVAWLILWALTTMEDTRGVVTANTETQLKTKTWAELARWFSRFIAKDLFDITATRISIKSAEMEKVLRWRIDMVPWSENNTEAFAGLHNQGKRILLVMDEASAIPAKIHEVAEGALTDADTQIIWLMCGNPTLNTGRFVEAFPGGKFAHRWQHFRVDSRTVRFSNKSQIDKWIADYGEDSDFVRVRVLGTFPRTGTQQFIPSSLVNEAAGRDPTAEIYDPLIIGVDVGRFGGDDTVIFFRKGRDARTILPIRMQPADNTVAWSDIVARRVAGVALQYRADAVFVDGGGVGAGVIDALRRLRVPHMEVQFGSKPDQSVAGGDIAVYANKRAEMWGLLKDWLRGGAIPDDSDLREQLVSPMYGFDKKGAIQLERKEDMRARGCASPDIADALALTFAFPVMPSMLAGWPALPATTHVSEYDPFSEKALAA